MEFTRLFLGSIVAGLMVNLSCWFGEDIMNCKSGFTLIELMIVVIIMASLAAMVLPHLMNTPDEANNYIARSEITSITTALQRYRLSTGRYPTAADGGLKALVSPPSSGVKWKGPYLEDEAIDPWGRPYKYKCPGSHKPASFDLWSLGADEANEADNINNWDKKR